MATRAAWILSALTVGIYVARQLGPYNFGVLNYAIALTGIFSIIASMSVDEIIIRQLVRHPERRARELGNFLMLRLLLFGVMATALGITLLLLHTTMEVKWLCVSSILLITNLLLFSEDSLKPAIADVEE